uniref:Uncharacterized protein n=1 Tax=viral metagenome TaxID=1070528 RepID=A0A6C0E2A6_9ZZZZ
MIIINMWEESVNEYDWTNITGANTGKYNSEVIDKHNDEISNLILTNFHENHEDALNLISAKQHKNEEIHTKTHTEIIDNDETDTIMIKDLIKKETKDEKNNEISNAKNIYKYLFFIVLMGCIVFIFIIYRQKINKQFLFQ